MSDHIVERQTYAAVAASKRKTSSMDVSKVVPDDSPHPKRGRKNKSDAAARAAAVVTANMAHAPDDEPSPDASRPPKRKAAKDAPARKSSDIIYTVSHLTTTNSADWEGVKKKARQPKDEAGKTGKQDKPVRAFFLRLACIH